MYAFVLKHTLTKQNKTNDHGTESDGMNNHKSYLYKDVCEATLLQHEMPSVIPLLKETTLFHEIFFFFFFYSN